MCTSLTLKTKDGYNIHGRTMDFGMTFNQSVHILSNCAVPKCSVLMIEGNVHNTIYTSAMCSESRTYYYNTYENHQISAVKLFNEDLDATSIKAFPTTTTQAFNNMN